MTLHHLVLIGLWIFPVFANAQSWGIQMRGGDPAMHIVCDGELVAKYHHKGVSKPYFYPIIGPTGEPVTRGFPMDPQPDEQTDHVHHRSMWFGHRDVNGFDFWSEQPEGEAANPKIGKIVHTALGSIRAGSNPLEITARNDWLAGEGNLICQDERTYRFAKTAEGFLTIDWDITIKATQGDVTFGDVKDGGMGLRVIPTLRLKPVNADQKATGNILNSEGVAGKEAWGKRAAWIDYFGTERKGNPIGIAIFNHPENLRHPTWWHARDYGLVAANPFGIQSFEKTEEPEGRYTIPEGGSLRLRYRFLVHPDTPDKAGVAKAYTAYVKED